ncbi:hypothetical protein AURDEDRAFT_170245 [Auricularia subglabra TFB-10046 SS5]|nr:hypothetical protein AURDEDRAFT_170245 [Auricularia subglabra TFB-10046 SS5]
MTIAAFTFGSFTDIAFQLRLALNDALSGASAKAKAIPDHAHSGMRPNTRTRRFGHVMS